MTDDPKPKRKPPNPGAYARNGDPQTSHDAAEQVPVAKLEAAVLQAMPVPLTVSEISERSGIRLNCVSPRMRPLARKGLVVEDGKRVPAGYKREQIVWKRVWRVLIIKEATPTSPDPPSEDPPSGSTKQNSPTRNKMIDIQYGTW